MATIPLTQGQVAIIDDNDLEAVQAHRWMAQKSRQAFYAVSDILSESGRKQRIYLHRFLMKPAKGYTVKHKDGDGLNNRRENLEVCAEGHAPRQRTDSAPAKSKYRGVHYVPQGAKHWKAVLTVNGKNQHLGVFKTQEEAARVRDAAAYGEWGKDASLNFPDEFANSSAPGGGE